MAAGCERDPLVTFNGEIMGTTYTVKLLGPADADEMERGVMETLVAVNQQMSTYLPDSALSRFNSVSSTDWHAVPDDLIIVIKTAQEISKQSAGAFDVTVASLVELWGFGPDELQPAELEAGAVRPSEVEPANSDRVPKQSLRASVGENVGYDYLEYRLDPAALRKRRAGLRVDLSAIAKGYGVDAAADYLSAHGIENFLVEIGGEIRARGVNTSGQPWRIGIEKPNFSMNFVGGDIHRIVSLNNMSMATSGDYRNFFERDGVRYSHTFDPRANAPVQHALASVTVLHNSAMHADAWATALSVLGPQDGPMLAEKLELAALFLIRESDGLVEKTTSGFERLERPPTVN